MVHNLFVISKQRNFNPASSLPITPSFPSTSESPENPEESNHVEQKIVYPDETVLSTNLITMPQQSNVYGKVSVQNSSFCLISSVVKWILILLPIFQVFGGFLMRQAYELAFACAWRLTGRRPAFLALDDLTFLAPVEVCVHCLCLLICISFLYLMILYTNKNLSWSLFSSLSRCICLYPLL